MNKSVVAAQYAVRGPLVQRSVKFNQQIQDAKNKGIDAGLPFDEVINCNIGNPQQLKQAPVNYVRDVISLVVNPTLMERASGVFAPDVVERAKAYLNAQKGGAISAGAYTDSHGLLAVRKEVSKFLEERDGFAGDVNDIVLTNGASDGVKLCMSSIFRPKSEGFNDGLLTPIPQYPLYSALCSLLDAELVPYYLNEAEGWTCSKAKLSEAMKKASGVETRALVVINPGNPTGQVMGREDMQEIISFCVDHNIVLMADEVYQENIYTADKEFLSFRRVAHEMGVLKGDMEGLQLISFHSISKGYTAECGLRGGYCEVIGLDPEVKKEIYKLASISLCSNVVGQIAMGIMVQPPKEGEASHKTFMAEKQAILDSLQRRSKRCYDTLNELENVECAPMEGALYAFPTIKMPKKAMEAAAAKDMAADAMYCGELLDATGIVIVPGTGFHQEPGTFHFRTTILPPEETMDKFFALLKEFHADFLKRYA